MKWKRIIGRTLGGLAALLIVAAIAGYIYLRSSGFQQYALHKIVEQADSATGGRTQIGSLDFSLSTLTAHLYNITVHGTEGPEDHFGAAARLRVARTFDRASRRSSPGRARWKK